MSLDTNSIVHECNVIRRRIQEEFKNLTLNFIVYNAEQQQVFSITDIVEKHQNEIGFDLSQFDFNDENNYTIKGSCFLGLRVDVKKSVLLPLKKIKCDAVFLINAAEFNDKTQVQFNIHHLCWHAIRLYEKVHNNKLEQSTFIKSTYDDFSTRLRENLLADIFSSITLQQFGYVLNLNKLARIRCQDLFEIKKNYMAEIYPYPIACEATIMLLEEHDDIKATQQKKPISNIVALTYEVKETFDDSAIEQWFQFAKAAQDMIWKGLDKNRVLQTAIYTCEDPFVRSVAYLVSELLNVDPHPVSDMQYHNPFTDDEANERLHYRLCKNQLKDVLNNTDNYMNKNNFIDKIDTLIQHQNKLLKDGVLIGWCVPALKEARSVYKSLIENEKIKEQQRLNAMQDVYQKSCHMPPWSTLKELSAKIIQRKRRGLHIDRDVLLSITSRMPDSDVFLHAFDPPDSASSC